jgi:hypothetical protein
MNDFNQMQDLSGLPPYMQNIVSQQQATQQAMAQGNQLAQQALGDSQAMKMANALRQGQAQQPQGTDLSLKQQFEIMRLGSNPYSSTSDYSTGANGWGNYGE